MDENIICEIIKSIDTAIEATVEIYNYISENKHSEAKELVSELYTLIKSINNYYLPKEGEDITYNKICESILYSIRKINIYLKTRSNKLLNKIEFELLPLIEELKLEAYKYKVINYGKEEEKIKFFEEDIKELCYNKYVEESEKSGQYKYDLSIMVVGYNKLDYTKNCISSIIKEIPDYINYELILINHGSSDGTEEYFEKVSPTKQIDILKNGGGLIAFSKIMEGKYFMTISNDIVIGKNAIENMYKCISNSEDIGVIVPSTCNISNNQRVKEAVYSNMDDFEAFVKENNKYDPYRHEERVRLCNPVTVGKTSLFYSKQGIHPDRFILANDVMSFPDDKMSLMLRRKGYKLILQNDAYCHHFGSVTIKEEMDNKGEGYSDKFYLRGRKAFFNEFGIDPWGKGSYFIKEVINSIEYKDTNKNILSIDCGLGSMPLKIREEIYEKYHKRLKMDAILTEKNYYEDIKYLYDNIIELDNIIKINFDNIGDQYDYIVCQAELNEENKEYLLNNLYKLMDNGCQLCIYDKNNYINEEFFVNCNISNIGKWKIIIK